MSHPQVVCVSEEAGGDLPDTLRRSLKYGLDTNSKDHTVIWARMSRELPGGWAGFAVWPDRVVFGFVDPVAGAASIPAIRRELAKEHPGFLWNNIDVRATRWSYAQLEDWSRFAIQTLHSHGFDTRNERMQLGWAIDVPKNIIEIDFTDGEMQARGIATLRAAPIPCNLILTRVTGIARFL